MRRAVPALILTAIGVLGIARYVSEPATEVVTITAPTTSPTPTGSTGPDGTAGGTTQTTDGTATGSAAQTRFGDVQVQITVSSGAITDVTVLAYPNGDPRSAAISSQTLPVLIEETLASQSADVDTLSGATYTSEGYRTSLQSAIDAARSEGLLP
jgi:uncharacterized protein with FMN-binding domain